MTHPRARLSSRGLTPPVTPAVLGRYVGNARRYLAVFDALAPCPRRSVGWMAEGIRVSATRAVKGRVWMSVLAIVVLVFEGLMGLMSLYIAYSLFSKTPPSVQKGRDALRYPRWYWVLAGVLALIGGVGLLVGLALPVVGAAAALWMVAYFVVAALTHVSRQDWVNLGAPIVLLLIFGGLLALRWTDAKPLLAFIGL